MRVICRILITAAECQITDWSILSVMFAACFWQNFLLLLCFASLASFILGVLHDVDIQLSNCYKYLLLVCFHYKCHLLNRMPHCKNLAVHDKTFTSGCNSGVFNCFFIEDIVKSLLLKMRGKSVIVWWSCNLKQLHGIWTRDVDPFSCSVALHGTLLHILLSWLICLRLFYVCISELLPSILAAYHCSISSNSVFLYDPWLLKSDFILCVLSVLYSSEWRKTYVITRYLSVAKILDTHLHVKIKLSWSFA